MLDAEIRKVLLSFSIDFFLGTFWKLFWERVFSHFFSIGFSRRKRRLISLWICIIFPILFPEPSIKFNNFRVYTSFFFRDLRTLGCLWIEYLFYSLLLRGLSARGYIKVKKEKKSKADFLHIPIIEKFFF